MKPFIVQVKVARTSAGMQFAVLAQSKEGKNSGFLITEYKPNRPSRMRWISNVILTSHYDYVGSL